MMFKKVCCAIVLLASPTLLFGGQAVSGWKLPSNHIPVGCRLQVDDNFGVSISFSKNEIKPGTDDGSWWGLYDSLGNYVFDHMEITGTSPHVLPHKYFSFLANPNEMALKKTSYGYILTIKGGDGGESYVCEFQFHTKDKVTKRIVYNPSFPEETREEFVFSEKEVETN